MGDGLNNDDDVGPPTSEIEAEMEIKVETTEPKGWGSQLYDGINNASAYVDKKVMGGYDEAIKNRNSILSIKRTSSGRPTIFSLNVLRVAARATIATTRYAVSTARSAVACVAYGTYHAVAAPLHAVAAGLNIVAAVANRTLAQFSPNKKEELIEASKNNLREAARHTKETVISTVIGGATVIGVGATLATAGVAPAVGGAILGVAGPVVGPVIANAASPVISAVNQAAGIAGQGVGMIGKAAQPVVGKAGTTLKPLVVEAGKLIQPAVEAVKPVVGTVIHANQAPAGLNANLGIAVATMTPAGAVVGVKGTEALTGKEAISGKKFKDFRENARVEHAAKVAAQSTPQKPKGKATGLEV
jgi:hypothetical protein